MSTSKTRRANAKTMWGIWPDTKRGHSPVKRITDEMWRTHTWNVTDGRRKLAKGLTRNEAWFIATMANDIGERAARHTLENNLWPRGFRR